MTLQPLSSVPYRDKWSDFSASFSSIFAVRSLPSVNEDYFEEEGSPRYSPHPVLYIRDEVTGRRQGGNSPIAEGEEDEEGEEEEQNSRRMMPRSNAIFKFGPHYLDKKDNVEKLSIEIHKLVDLVRYFILRNKKIFPYIIARFESVKVSQGYDYKLVLSNFRTHMKLVFSSKDCLREFAFYLLRYNRFLGIFNVFVPGFLFYKLRVVLQHYAPFLSFEFLTRCSIKWPESFIFRNQFGVYFLVVLKLDYACKTGRNWTDELYYGVDEKDDPSSPGFHKLIASARCLGGLSYAKFQDCWKFFSGVYGNFWNPSLARVRPDFQSLRFVLRAELSLDIHLCVRQAEIVLSGKPNSYCKVLPSTPRKSEMRDCVVFRGESVFADAMKFLFLSSSPLYDCDNIFYFAVWVFSIK